MEKKYKYLLLSIISLIFIIGFFFIKYDLFIFFLLATILYFILYIIDYYLIKSKIKSGLYIRIGNNKREYFEYVMPIIFIICDLVFFILPKNKYRFWETSYFLIFFPLIIIIRVTFEYYNYILLLKEKTIAINYKGGKYEWSLSKIIKVVINNNRFQFYKKNDLRGFTLDNEEDILRVKQYLSEKLKDKLIIEA